MWRMSDAGLRPGRPGRDEHFLPLLRGASSCRFRNDFPHCVQNAGGPPQTAWLYSPAKYWPLQCKSAPWCRHCSTAPLAVADSSPFSFNFRAAWLSCRFKRGHEDCPP